MNVKHNDMFYESIRNFSFEQFFSLFKTTSLDISTFWLINSGYDKEGNKKYVHLIIRGCKVRPFFGPHLVSVQNEKGELDTFWVNSLTHLRRNIFHFTDRLSFERSTYLIPFHNSEVLVRIKSIRCFLNIPFRGNENEEPIAPRPKKVRQQLLDTCMQSMVTYISREVNGTKQNIVDEMKRVVDDFCNQLIAMDKI